MNRRPEDRRALAAQLRRTLAIDKGENTFRVNQENGAIIWDSVGAGPPLRYRSEPNASLLQLLLATVSRSLPVDEHL